MNRSYKSKSINGKSMGFENSKRPPQACKPTTDNSKVAKGEDGSQESLTSSRSTAEIETNTETSTTTTRANSNKSAHVRWHVQDATSNRCHLASLDSIGGGCGQQTIGFQRARPSKVTRSISSLFALIKTPSCDGLVPQPTARPFSSSMRAPPQVQRQGHQSGALPARTQSATEPRSGLNTTKDHHHRHHHHYHHHHHLNHNHHHSSSSQLVTRETPKNLEKAALDDEEMRNVDCGYAYIILAVMFIINANTFGSARAYGLIFKRLARDEDQTRSLAAMPFTIMGAIENMSGPLIGHLLVRGLSWRSIVFTGTCLVSLAHLLAGLFEWSLWGQILTMGLMCGFGLSCITISSFQINNAYFVRYRSRAFGLGLTGAVFGTLYMTPICQFTLNAQQSTKYCYLVLGLFLLPSVPLSLLLRPKPLPRALIEAETAAVEDAASEQISDKQLSDKQQKHKLTQTRQRMGTWQASKHILRKPIFHLIWPTQLLFCWFNFVFSIIIADFGRDRQLDEDESSNLLLIWAIGQFFGRIFLGAIVDMNFVSYKSFTIICLASIGTSTWLLNHVTPSPNTSPVSSQDYANLYISSIVFVLSMFIANLYILLNGLVLRYMETELAAMSLGLSSFLGSFFLLPRAHIIGFFREQYGAYDQMLDLFGYVAFASSLVWLLVPQLIQPAAVGADKQEPAASNNCDWSKPAKQDTGINICGPKQDSNNSKLAVSVVGHNHLASKERSSHHCVPLEVSSTIKQ